MDLTNDAERILTGRLLDVKAAVTFTDTPMPLDSPRRSTIFFPFYPSSSYFTFVVLRHRHRHRRHKLVFTSIIPINRPSKLSTLPLFLFSAMFNCCCCC